MLGLKDRFRMGRPYLALHVAIASTFGLTSYASGQSAPSDAQTAKIERQFADIHREIERLSELGQIEAASNIVGPDSVDWRMQDVECDLDQLLSEAERLCAPFPSNEFFEKDRSRWTLPCPFHER